MPDLPLKPIALAVIHRADKFLVARRKPDRELGGLWEFPGGKIEPGETAARAAEREALEELGCRIRAEREIAVIRHAYENFAVELRAFACDLAPGEQPRALDASEIAWMPLDALLGQPIPAANHALIEALKRQS